MRKWQLPLKSRHVILTVLLLVVLAAANSVRLIFHMHKTGIVNNHIAPTSPRGHDPKNPAIKARSVSVGDKKIPTKTRVSPSSQIYIPPPSSNKLWEDSELIPDWLKEYFVWHQQERERLSQNNWQHWEELKYLVPVAPKKLKSGGMTDRIRPVSAYLRMAAETKRMLLIYWERPFALEEFLLPPKGGCDWRVPGAMITAVTRFGPPYAHHSTNWTEVEELANGNETIITFQYQSWHYGELWYAEHAQEGEVPISEAFRDIWQVVFTPSPPVAKRIADNFQRMKLVPGEYTTVHIRALYGVKGRAENHTKQIAENAMNCGSHLRPGGPFFLASDSSNALKAALDYGKAKNVRVVTAHYSKQPLHLDLYTGNATPADFYDGFVDLHLMASTRCVAVGPGGFARWGHLLGYNRTCAIHHSGRKSQTWEWKSTLAPGEAMPGYASEQERLQLQKSTGKTVEIPRCHEPRLDVI